MKKKFLTSTFLFILLISACDGTSNNITPTHFLTETSISNTPKPLPTQTFTPYPTLTYQIQDEFFTILSNNGNCKLPCFWGITPNETSWDDASNFLKKYKYAYHLPFSIDQTDPTIKDTVYSVYVETTKDVRLLISLKVNVNKENIVSNIIFRTEIHQSDFPDLDTGDKHLDWYSPTEIFRKHGVPDNLYLEIGVAGDYSLGVVYENLKAVILLTGFAKENINNKRTVCPNLGDGDISYVNIALASPLDPIDVKTLIGHPFWEGVPPFEEVSGMSINDFYKLMIGSSEQPICIEGQKPN